MFVPNGDPPCHKRNCGCTRRQSASTSLFLIYALSSPSSLIRNMQMSRPTDSLIITGTQKKRQYFAWSRGALRILQALHSFKHLHLHLLQVRHWHVSKSWTICSFQQLASAFITHSQPTSIVAGLNRLIMNLKSCTPMAKSFTLSGR